MINNSITVFFLFFLFSCNVDNKEISINELEIDNGWQLQIQDTIQLEINAISLHFSDYNEFSNSYFAYDAGLKTIFQFDKNWKLKNQRSLSIEGPDSYGPQCFGFTIFQDSLLAISGLNGVFIYNTQFKLKKSYKRPENSFPAQQSNWQIYDLGINKESSNSKILSAYNNELSNDETKKPLAILELMDENNQMKINYFGEVYENSLYQKDRNFPQSKMMFSFNKKEKYIYKLNQLEPILYRYNFEGDLLNLIDLGDINFEKPKPINPDLKGRQRIKAQKENDRFMTLVSNSDLLVAVYFKGIDEEEKDIRPFLKVLKEGKRRLNDIPVLPPLNSVAKILPNNQLLFYGRSTVSEDKKNGTVFYLAELVKKD